jgi:hypothetical protein
MGGPNDRDYFTNPNGQVTDKSVREALERMGPNCRPTDGPDYMPFFSPEQREAVREHIRKCPH